MLYIWAIITGILVGFGSGAGAALMWKAPKKQAFAAFRTLGEMNACNGDPVSHFGFGLGFFFSSTAASIGTGGLTQDFLHRVIPNWAAAIISIGNRKTDKLALVKSPARMAVAGALIGMIVIPIVIGVPQVIPKKIGNLAADILVPSTTWLIKYIMPVLFLIAAMNGGLKVGVCSILIGTFYQFVVGNALPGIILGILLGSMWKSKGLKSSGFIILLFIILSSTILIMYFKHLFTTDASKWLDLNKISS